MANLTPRLPSISPFSFSPMFAFPSLLLWLLVDFHGLWWWLFLLLLVGCEVQVYLEGLEVGFVWFGMGFEVCESGGLWVSCGSGTVVVVVIIEWLRWLFFGLLWIFFVKVGLLDVDLCWWWLSMLLLWPCLLLVAVVVAVVAVPLLLLLMKGVNILF